MKHATHLCYEAFSNELRLKILQVLFKEELPVLEIASRLKAEQSRVSHALKILKQCHFVDVKKKGKQRIYFISFNVKKMFSLERRFKADNIFELMNKHIDYYCRKGCPRLKKNIEKGEIIE